MDLSNKSFPYATFHHNPRDDEKTIVFLTKTSNSNCHLYTHRKVDPLCHCNYCTGRRYVNLASKKKEILPIIRHENNSDHSMFILLKNIDVVQIKFTLVGIRKRSI